MTSEFYILKAEGIFEAMFFFDSAGFHGEVHCFSCSFRSSFWVWLLVIASSKPLLYVRLVSAIVGYLGMDDWCLKDFIELSACSRTILGHPRLFSTSF